MKLSLHTQSMFDGVVEFLSQLPFKNMDAERFEEWRQEKCQEWNILADSFLTQDEKIQGEHFLHYLMDHQYDFVKTISKQTEWTTEKRQENIQRLLNHPQVEQRTHEWYMEAANLLTASQFAKILKPGRTRGQLVLEKASGTVDTKQRRTVSSTAYLNPFTWGIRFEPVVKQIYSELTSSKLVDLGRLRHQTEKHLAASPDGLVVEGPPEVLGRFVEFKAPVTRIITKQIPDEYSVQMQIQMEVGNVEECDYLEVKFNSKYGEKEAVEPEEEPRFRGNIFVIGSSNEEGDVYPKRYEYSPLNTLDWLPTIEEGEIIMETVPWNTSDYFMITVKRQRAWFASVKPSMEAFWGDVELAKQGQFQLPESTRKPREKQCRIIEEPASEL